MLHVQEDAPSRKSIATALEVRALDEKAFWEDAKRVGNILAFEAFLKEFPRGRYASLAKASLLQLKSEEDTKVKLSAPQEPQKDVLRDSAKAVPKAPFKREPTSTPAIATLKEAEPKATPMPKPELPKHEAPKTEKKLTKDAQVAPTKIPVKPPFLRPSYSSGDRWTFQKTEVWLNNSTPRKQAPLEITEVSTSGYRAKSVSSSRTQSFTLNLDGNFLSKIKDQTVVNKYFQWPLVLGLAWSNDRRVLSPDGSVITIEEKCTAESLEVVTVPAGSFQTLRIDCHGFETLHNSGAKRFELSRWYSPEVKRAVKSTFKKWAASGLAQSDVYELTEFFVKF